MRSNSIWPKLLIVLVPVLLMAVARPAYAGADLYVNGDCGDDTWSGTNPKCVEPDGPKATIQAAIVEAINGDEIMVAPGTYRELINFLGKSIKLRSSDGPDLTIINGDIDDDGTGDGTVVKCVSNETANTVLDGFTITRGQASSGGGMVNGPGSPTVTNCIFTLNNAANGGGGMSNGGGGNPTVTRCIFSNNDSGGVGGGMSNAGSASPTVTNCTFSDNAACIGGGMSNIQTASPTVTNCIFTGNTAVATGGGMDNSGGELTVADCTFSQNSANVNGGAISGSVGTFANCIMFGNTSDGVDEIAGSPTVTYSDVSGGFEGEGNINVNPMFVDFPNQDYHLSPGSPCIDAADNTAVPPDTADLDGDLDTNEPTPFDLDGNPRFVDDPDTKDSGVGDPPIVDMGAYEFQEGSPGFCPWDFDGNGTVGATDLLALLVNWGPCP